MAAPPVNVSRVYERVAARARESGVFGPVRVEGDRVICQARDAAAPAEYRLGMEDGRLWVSLVTPDRWLSESIESDLMHTGDDLEELIEEELVEQGLSIGRLPFEHFRSEDRLFTFRSPLPVAGGDEAVADVAARALLAYEACFRNLGDVGGGGE